jgi:hypothetical protein
VDGSGVRATCVSRPAKAGATGLVPYPSKATVSASLSGVSSTMGLKLQQRCGRRVCQFRHPGAVEVNYLIRFLHLQETSAPLASRQSRREFSFHRSFGLPHKGCSEHLRIERGSPPSYPSPPIHVNFRLLSRSTRRAATNVNTRAWRPSIPRTKVIPPCSSPAISNGHVHCPDASLRGLPILNSTTGLPEISVLSRRVATGVPSSFFIVASSRRPDRRRHARSTSRPGVQESPLDRNTSVVVRASFAAPAPLVAAWRSHVPPYESCSPSSPTQDAVLGRPTRPLDRLGSTGDPHLDVATRPFR